MCNALLSIVLEGEVSQGALPGQDIAQLVCCIPVIKEPEPDTIGMAKSKLITDQFKMLNWSAINLEILNWSVFNISFFCFLSVQYQF